MAKSFAQPTTSTAKYPAPDRQRVCVARPASSRAKCHWSPALDQCLRAGIAQGRRGVREATERVIAQYPALTRAQCWQRLRWLREHGCGERPLPNAWPADLLKRLREGYAKGGMHKRAAFRAVRARYPGLPGHVIVRVARQQGWLGGSPTPMSPRRRWTATEQARFAAMAECRTVAQMALALGRSTNAIRWRLGAQSLSAKNDTIWSLRQLASTLRVGTTTLRRWSAERTLQVRDAHITGDSLRAYLAHSAFIHERAIPGGVMSTVIAPDQHYRWKDTARILGCRIDVVRQGIAQGVFKLADPKVSDRALARFFRQCAFERLNMTRIDQAIYRWLAREYRLPTALGEKDNPTCTMLQRFGTPEK